MLYFRIFNIDPKIFSFGNDNVTTFCFFYRGFNRRRSPLQFRGNNRNNRGRMNQWNRRSPSPRDRGGGGGGRGMMNVGGGNRFDNRRNQSPQRRFSRERRFSPAPQNQFRKYSPQWRGSPPRRSRERRPNSRDRRPSSPLRGSSPERGGGRGSVSGGGAGGGFNRWDQPQRNAGPTAATKPKQRSPSPGSNWEDESDSENMKKNTAANRRSSEERKASPAPASKERGRKNRSHSRSQERYKRTVANRSRESGGKSF